MSSQHVWSHAHTYEPLGHRTQAPLLEYSPGPHTANLRAAAWPLPSAAWASSIHSAAAYKLAHLESHTLGYARVNMAPLIHTAYIYTYSKIGFHNMLY